MPAPVHPAPALPAWALPAWALPVSALPVSALPGSAPAGAIQAGAALAGAPLRAVGRSALPRLVAVSAVLAGVGCVLAGQLLLSVATADGAYRLAGLRGESAQLDRQQQVRTEQLRALAAPQRLAVRAVALGLVPEDAPAYLNTTTGRVLGAAQPAR